MQSSVLEKAVVLKDTLFNGTSERTDIINGLVHVSISR